MMNITAKAYGKLNLVLGITGQLSNGYHTIETVFQSVSLFDQIKITNGFSKNSVLTESLEIPQNSENICIKSAELFFEKTGICDGVQIEIEKHIPVAAGMAGGSADAAAVLVALNTMYGVPLSTEQILLLAQRLGADVPFCVLGGTVAATGIGEKLHRLKPISDADILIIKQGKKPSTGELYKRLDSNEFICNPDFEKAVAAIESENSALLYQNVKNVFATVWGSEIETIKSEFTLHGAKCAELSGSGPAVFGIFEKCTAGNAQKELQNKYGKIYICHPKNCGVEITDLKK